MSEKPDDVFSAEYHKYMHEPTRVYDEWRGMPNQTDKLQKEIKDIARHQNRTVKEMVRWLYDYDGVTKKAHNSLAKLTPISLKRILYHFKDFDQPSKRSDLPPMGFYRAGVDNRPCQK